MISSRIPRFSPRNLALALENSTSTFLILTRVSFYKNDIINITGLNRRIKQKPTKTIEIITDLDKHDVHGCELNLFLKVTICVI